MALTEVNMLLDDIDIYMIINGNLLLRLTINNRLTKESNKHKLFRIWFGYHIICYVIVVAHDIQLFRNLIEKFIIEMFLFGFAKGPCVLHFCL